jgi:two-component system OmpR family response regulator
VLIVEDDAKIADLLSRGFRRSGWSVEVADNGEDAIWQGAEFTYDVIVLDVGLPDLDGFAVCRALRDKEVWIPVLMLTARDAVADRVLGLDAGADDYLAKPFSIDEVSARLRALTRRTLGVRPVVLEVNGLQLDPAERSVTLDGASISLSAKEFAVLEALMRRAGEVVSRTDLLDHAWSSGFDGTSNVADVYIGYLRQKIERPAGRRFIETVRGAGYRLTVGAT